MAEEDTIVLTDEDGEEHEFNIVEVLEVEDREYAILVGAEDAQAIALRIEREDGQDFLVEIEDDEEWDQVADAWNSHSEEHQH